MKWLEDVWTGALYIAVLGSAWVLTARDLGVGLVAEVGHRPFSVAALVLALAFLVVVVSAWLARYLGPVRASNAELMLHDRPRGAAGQLGVVALGSGAAALVLGTLVVCVGLAEPGFLTAAVVAACAAFVLALVWPLLALAWQRRGGAMIPRWRLIGAHSRAQALSTTVLTLDSTAMEAAADLEKLSSKPPRTNRVPELAAQKNAVDLSRLGPAARGAGSGTGNGDALGVTAPAVSAATAARRLAFLAAARAAKARLPLIVLTIVAPALVGALGSARLALAAAVLLAMVLAASLARTLGEFASLHRLRRQWALVSPFSTVVIAAGLVAAGVVAAVAGVAAATASAHLVNGAPLVHRSGSAAAFIGGWYATAIAAVVSGVVGAAAAAVKSMKAEVKFMYSPEFGPMPVHIFERLAAGKVGPVLCLLALLNGYGMPALIVAAVVTIWGIVKLREEIAASDHSDTHLARESVLA